MSKHTPGPWIAQKRDGDEWWFGGQDGAEIVIRAAGAKTYDNFAVIGASISSEGEADANARLIAAAPDLLSALERALPTVEHMYHTTDDADGSLWQDVLACRAAIAKATGEAA